MTQDLYAKLEVESDAPLSEIHAVIENKRRDYRKFAKINSKRELATELKDIVEQASVVFKTNESRAEYDAKLKSQRETHVDTQAMANEDYYELLRLPPIATLEQIRKKISALAAKPETAERAKFIGDVLLDPAKKADYDSQLASRKAYDNEKNKRPAVPLDIDGIEVSSLFELEAAVDAKPVTALRRLIDGEMAAWVEWGLGKRNQSFRFHDFTRRAIESPAPFMELDELLREFNPERPLVVYADGQAPGKGDAPVLRRAEDIPKQLAQHRAVLIQRFDYILDWLSAIGCAELVDKLDSLPALFTAQVQLERLVYLIDSSSPAAALEIQGVTNNLIDFGTISRVTLSALTQSITLSQQGNQGYLYGQIRSDSEWLSVSGDIFEGASTPITVTVDLAKLEKGKAYEGRIGFRPIDGRRPNIVVQVKVYQQTTGETVSGAVKGIKEGLGRMFRGGDKKGGST